MRYLFFVFILVLFSCKENVEKTNVISGNITESIYASGIIKSGNQYMIFPKTSGIIDAIYFEEGENITTNDIILHIANESARISSKSAEQTAQINDFQNNQYLLTDLKQRLNVAKNKYKVDSINFNRNKNLFDKKLISSLEYEKSELVFQSSKSEYISIQSKILELKNQLSLLSSQSKSNMLISKRNEDDFNIKSEINGTLFALLKEKGELVSPQTPLALVGDANNYFIELQIDENDIHQIQINQHVIVQLDSYKNEVYTAKIKKISPYLNEKSRTFKIKATFDKKPKTLYPNLSLEANIIIAQKDNSLLVPRSFLNDKNEVTLEDGTIKKVKTGLINFEYAEIIKGLSKNQIIIKEK